MFLRVLNPFLAHEIHYSCHFFSAIFNKKVHIFLMEIVLITICLAQISCNYNNSLLLYTQGVTNNHIFNSISNEGKHIDVHLFVSQK